MAIEEAHRQAVLAFINDRERARRVQRDALFEHACQDFARVVELIVCRYHPTEVWQWGSLLYPETFTAESDIDIGLVGVSVRDHMAILRQTEDTACLPLHIARMEEMADGNVQLIHRWGKRVRPTDSV